MYNRKIKNSFSWISGWLISGALSWGWVWISIYHDAFRPISRTSFNKKYWTFNLSPLSILSWEVSSSNIQLSFFSIILIIVLMKHCVVDWLIYIICMIGVHDVNSIWTSNNSGLNWLQHIQHCLKLIWNSNWGLSIITLWIHFLVNQH
jgi:hypothetical protein